MKKFIRNLSFAYPSRNKKGVSYKPKCRKIRGLLQAKITKKSTLLKRFMKKYTSSKVISN